MIDRIAILGTGLLGASTGLALRAAGFKGSIAGWNRGAEGAQIALKSGAIDSIALDPISAAREADVTVLSVPIYATLDLMEQLTTHLGSDHLVTDVGSTKLQITKAGMKHFNQIGCAAFLPGHPMAGKSVAARNSAMRTSSAARRGSLPTHLGLCGRTVAVNSSSAGASG